MSKNGNDNGELKGGLGGGQDPHQTLKEAAASLVASKKPPELKVPPKKRPDMTALDLLDIEEEEAEARDREIAPQVKGWMEGESLPNLERIEAKLKKRGPKMLELVAGKDEEGKPFTFGQQRDEYIRFNEEYLTAAFPIGETADGEAFVVVAKEVRKVAHMAVLKHRLKQEMDREQLKELEAQFKKERYFLEDQDGLIRLPPKRYALSDSEDFGELTEADERLIAEIIGNHVSRINALYKGDVQQRAELLKKESELSLDDLLSGKEGKCLVHARAETHGTFNLLEVYVQVEGDGNGRAYILDATGPDKDRAIAIRDKKLFLWLSSLNIPRPPRVETLMDKGFAEDGAKLIQAFWGYLDRAKRAVEEKNRREHERELAAHAKKAEDEVLAQLNTLKNEMAKKATISLDRVLMEMEPMAGVFFAEYDGEWHNPDHTNIRNGLLFFLGEQSVEDGKPYLRVREVPSHLKDFFTVDSMSPCSYGEKFQGLDQPFQAVMKALHRQETKKVVQPI